MRDLWVNRSQCVRRIVGSLLVSSLWWSPVAARTEVASPDAATCLDPREALAQYRIETWCREAGLPDGVVHAIAQTADGYLWLGTQLGVVRFDGLRFVVFNNTNQEAFEDHYISHLLADAEGSLWVGAYGAGLSQLKNVPVHTLSEREGLPGDQIRAVLQDQQGDIWLAVDRVGVARLSGGQIRTWTRAEGLVDDRAFALLEESSGVVWVGGEAGVSRIGPEGVASFGPEEGGFPGTGVRAIVRSGNRVYFGSRQGLVVREGGAFRLVPELGGHPLGTVSGLWVDRRERLWVGTILNGLFRVDGDEFQHFPSDVTGTMVRGFSEASVESSGSAPAAGVSAASRMAASKSSASITSR